MVLQQDENCFDVSQARALLAEGAYTAILVAGKRSRQGGGPNAAPYVQHVANECCGLILGHPSVSLVAGHRAQAVRLCKESVK